MKMKLINQTPDESFIYPATIYEWCNQRFKMQWCKAHPWIHYSRSVDGVFFSCKSCVLFAPKEYSHQKLGNFVSKPFRLWTKQSSAFQSHETCKYHQDSISKTQSFKTTIENPSTSVANMLNTEIEERMQKMLVCLSL